MSIKTATKTEGPTLRGSDFFKVFSILQVLNLPAVSADIDRSSSSINNDNTIAFLNTNSQKTRTADNVNKLTSMAPVGNPFLIEK